MRRLASVLLLVAVPAFAGESGAYLEGLDALARGDFDGARKRLEAAVDADDDAPDPHLALGVALTFLERFEPAFAELERADALQRGKQLPKQVRDAPRLWKATVVAMRGDLPNDVNHYPAATREPFELDLRSMSRRYGDPAFRARVLNDPRPDADAVRARERAMFPALAKRFVERTRPAMPQLAGPLRARGLERFGKGQFAEALPDLLDAHRADGDDVPVLAALAGTHLALGHPEAARALYTRVLTKDVTARDAYLGRALAHAYLGDGSRAKADLDVARRLGADVTAAENRANRAAGSPPAPVSLRDVVAAPTRAMELVRSIEARRLRADETYQDRLRVLTEAGDLTALGEFLYENAMTTLVEWVEPRAQPMPIRPSDRDAELTQAERVLEQAIAKNGDDVRARALRAACRMARLDWQTAGKELEAALDRAPRDPVVLDLVARLEDHAAAVKSAAASDLRSTKSWSDWTWIYTRWPSPAELAQAGALESEARRLRERARAARATAATEAAGTVRGDLLRARIAEVDGDFEGARAAAADATKRDATSLAAWRKLAELEGRLGHPKESALAQSEAANLTHSTAGPMLRYAWGEIARTAYQGAGEALAVAQEADPADPRVAAYRGVIAEARNRPDDAAGWYAAALALSTARAELVGVRLGASGPRLLPSEVAPTMRLAFRVGRVALGRNDAEAARATLEPYAAWIERVDVPDRYAPVPSAMLPGPFTETGQAPPSPHLETIAAWIRLRLGDALMRAGRAADALPHFEWVVDFERRKPAIVDVGQEIREPATLASAHRVRALLALGRRDEAARAFLSVPRRRDLPPPSQAELERLRTELSATLGR